MNLMFLFNSGKNVKLFYFIKEILRDHTPRIFFRKFDSYLEEARRRPDFAQIMERVRYYCKQPGAPLGPDTVAVRDLDRHSCQSTYYYDVKHATTPFPEDIRINFLPGDITHVPPCPAFVKSRPVHGDNANSVILKFNRIRHFIRVNDRVPFSGKADMAVFRGKVPGKPKRARFFEMYYDHPLADLGDSQCSGTPWDKPKMTISEQLRYKFILSIEGNDVASNLKWVMGSGSVAVMPQPEFETWFMEGRLVPEKHYIEIDRDFSDFPEKIEWYIRHPEAARKIVRQANEYCTEFYDSRRERIIEVLTVGAYLGLLDH